LAGDAAGEGSAAAEVAARELKTVRAELMQTLSLDSIKLPSMLEEFCADPLLGASKTFLSDVLSYAQGILDRDTLIQKVEAVLPSRLQLLTEAAYEAWLVYTSMLLLEPTAAWSLSAPDGEHIVRTPAKHLELGYQDLSVMMRLPEVILECPQGILGIKAEVKGEIDFYQAKPQRRRDFSSGGKTNGVTGRRYVLFYRFNEESSYLIAERDKATMLKPEVMIGTFVKEDFATPMGIAQTLAHIEALAPTQGARFAASGEALGKAQELANQSDTPAFTVQEIGYYRRRLAQWLPEQE
jgi:hypothetical protein